MSADVDLQNISVTFGNFYAAKNVSVKIQEGEFFSFLGPSGCCLLYTSPSPRDRTRSRMPSSA